MFIPSLKKLSQKVLKKTPYRVVRHSTLLKLQAQASKQAQEEMSLSLVVASYNVAPYIERFLASVFGQSVELPRFEVILVNDGSTDHTGKIIDDWQARYPNHIRVVHQPNAGVSAARNAGLALATGTWISFPDPDDFLHIDYFKHMLAELRRKQSKPLVAVVSNLIFYFEDRDTFSDSHPLRYRFAKAVTRLPSHDLGQFMQLSACVAWIHRDTLARHALNFDHRVSPTFEDAHLFNRLLIAAPERTVSFVSNAKYYYRKRSDQSSLVDNAKINPRWYIEQIEHGYLDLLKRSAAQGGFAKVHLQRLCLYDVFWRFRYLVDHPERAAFLSPEQRATFLRLLEEVFAHIDADTIAAFNLAGCTEEHKVALLALYKGQRRAETSVYVQQIDSRAGMAQFSYHIGGGDHFDLRIQVNGAEVTPQWPSHQTASFLDRDYHRTHFFWVPLQDGDEIAFVRDDDAPCVVKRSGRVLGKEVSWLSLRTALQIAPPKTLDAETQRLRAYVLAKRDTYRGAMVLMDREDKADDNAEHLYRHLMATGRAENAWFILSPDSPDWPRLQAEGFQLLAYGSDDHIAAQMNADFLISSHADHFILWPAPRKDFADLARYRFVFLQHGVTTNDLSLWLNTKPIRLFMTATPDEKHDIARADGSYMFSKREVLLSGFPRHDALWSKGQTAQLDSILILPTWRKYLTDEPGRDGMRRGKIDDFLSTDYARNWLNFLKSPKLKAIADAHGVRIVFAPHPNIAKYLEDMELPEHIEIVNVMNGGSYQDLFARARLAVTCFSSAATEVAYLQRPVVYFQFDADQIFNGNHVYNQGYFSFERDGFGPVTHTADEALFRIEQALEGQEDPVYAARRDMAFPFRDGQCCERVCQAIEAITCQSHPQPKTRISPKSDLPVVG